MTSAGAEKIIESMGGFGRFQLRFFVLFGYALLVLSGVLMVMTFSTAEPPWRCTTNSSLCTLNGTFKVGDKHYDDRCKLPRKEWEFAVDGDFDSIVTEWVLVCDTAVYVSVVNSTTFILYMIGAMIASILSDKFGRRNVVYSFACLGFLSGVISAFAQAYWVFAMFRALAGVGIGACTICGFVLLMEYCGPSYRSRVGFSLWYFWILAMVLLALLGYLIPSWRTLTIVTSAPGILILVSWWFSPESLRWLIVKGKTDQATEILKSISRTNNKTFSEADIALLKHKDIEDDEKPKLGNIKDLFVSRSIAARTLISWYCWFVSGLIYYGISLSTPSVGGNMYLNFFISAVCEGIAMAIGMYILDKFGRKRSIVVCIWLAGLSMIVGALLQHYDTGSDGFLAGKILASLVFGKVFITIVFDGVYIYSSELFPTVVRNTAMGTSTSSARIGSAAAPYIVYTERLHPLAPFTVMAVAAIIGGVLCMLLPETCKMSMPDTIQQINMNAKNHNEDEEKLKNLI